MKVLVIYTGGTIGMVKDSSNNSLKPGSVQAIQEYIMSEFSTENISYINTQQEIDSSNFRLEFYAELAELIENNYTNYDAFLILMGTDTMAYVGSLLSYCTEGLTKPIVFTGGQLPLSEKKSDSKENLKGALNGIFQKEFPNEVGLFFYHKWMRAVQTTKVSSVDLDAYAIPNSNQLRVNFSSEIFRIEKKIQTNIEIFNIHPFSNNCLLKKVLSSETLNGIILVVFGLGNLPDFDNELSELFKEKINKGFRVVVVSQCLRGGVEIGKYEVSLKSKVLGFVSGEKLTVESALAKMMYLSTKPLNFQQYQAFFKESIRGE